MIAIAIVLVIIIVAFILLVHFNVIDLEMLLGENESVNGKGNKTTPTSAELSEIDLDHCIKIHFIDVGQGDSILVELGTDTILLIDAGHTGVSISEDGKKSDRPYGYNQVPKAVTEPYFEYITEIISNHGGDIDYLIATHADSDHINMLPKVFDRFQVNEVYMNDCYPSVKTNTTTEVTEEKAATEPNCTTTFFSTGDDSVIPIEKEDYKLTIYSAGNDGFRGARTKENSMSIMCLLEYSGKKVLFTGDAEVETEKWFVEMTGSDPDFDIDVLKVAHHGSSSSSCEEFLDYIHAEYAVISSGKNNAYGHPTEVVMTRLQDRMQKIYDTQDDGTITLYIDVEGDYCFVTEKSAEAAE